MITLLWKVDGKRARGRSPIRWSDQVQTILGLNIPTAMRQAADRAVWKKLVDTSVKALQDEHDLQ
ncbi:hypothetical protein RR48_12508 [Papilio machaon]|uniref:Uncharacterized protein n=1 Tax=Papilio machaon TaxID=76193 RepID=A0A194RNA8_PAPMA|nr:hypothetical protein RR48_12508 [Papilio machaon]